MYYNMDSIMKFLNFRQSIKNDISKNQKMNRNQMSLFYKIWKIHIDQKLTFKEKKYGKNKMLKI